jgi:hypothetical protein
MAQLTLFVLRVFSQIKFTVACELFDDASAVGVRRCSGRHCLGPLGMQQVLILYMGLGKGVTWKGVGGSWVKCTACGDESEGGRRFRMV